MPFAGEYHAPLVLKVGFGRRERIRGVLGITILTILALLLNPAHPALEWLILLILPPLNVCLLRCRGKLHDARWIVHGNGGCELIRRDGRRLDGRVGRHAWLGGPLCVYRMRDVSGKIRNLAILRRRQAAGDERRMRVLQRHRFVMLICV